MNRNAYHILDIEEHKNRFAEVGQEFSPFDLGIPLLDIADKAIQEIYYFRFNTYCKHIKATPCGYVVTEFLPDVPWAGKYNTISCPAGHHLYEGRWLHCTEIEEDYAKFWFTDEASPRLYSTWLADAIFAVCKVRGDISLGAALLGDMKKNYTEWEKSHKKECGLFYQLDGYDGMEFSISGSGLRPTINSYMYGDASAIANIARLIGDSKVYKEYERRAEELKRLINDRLWDESAEFYKVVYENGGYANVREEIGYIPWYFCIPEERMSAAWRFLTDKVYFFAPFGPTTAEQNHPDFMKPFKHPCLWNGPSWPFATSQTLTALANLLNRYSQGFVTANDYLKLLKIYTASHYIKTPDGKKTPFIDEDLDPFDGEWLARKYLMKNEPASPSVFRGKDYNHSTYCDLIISGLAGIRPDVGSLLEISPLFTQSDLDYFCLDGVLYHGHFIAVMWDKSGERYHMGKGFRIYVDGTERAYSPVPGFCTVKLLA